MKIGKIIIICLLLTILTAGCSTAKNEYETEINSLKEQLVQLEDQIGVKSLENIKLKVEVDEYEKKTVPNLMNEIKEKDKTYGEEVDKYQRDVAGLDYQRLLFKKDIDTVLSYLSSSGYIPVYEGEIHSYTQKHIELINNWFVEFSDDRVKDTPTELMEWLYPVVFPIKITQTEVGFVSQYENAYYYNVVHYMTYGMKGDYNESKTIRAIGGVEDGFRERYIIEIYQENSEWKVGYTGFGG